MTKKDAYEINMTKQTDQTFLTVVSRVLPADLGAILIFVLLTYAVILLPVINESPVRAIIGLVFVLFVPGYALVAALFPESQTSSPQRLNDTDHTVRLIDRGIDGKLRVALSFGLSIALVPLFGLILSLSTFGIGLVPMLILSSIFIVVMVAIASFRRLRLSKEDRFQVPFRMWYANGKNALTGNSSRRSIAINLVLALVILLSVSTLAYAVVSPPSGEEYTEFYVLSENADGELVAANYTSEYQVGEPHALTIGFENYEGETVEYTVVIQLQDITTEGTESTVTDRHEVKRFSETLENNETLLTQRNLSLTSDVTGSNLQLVFLLYDETPPENPDRDNAKQSLHLWIDVEEGNESG